MPHEHLITTPATARICQACDRPVLAGYMAGLLVVADPTPLDLDGYRAALVAGRKTVRLVRGPVHEIAKHHGLAA
ncbi:hypothetical protein ACPA54_15185 [Uniformispora flossi]|uniref:hypothetical protein n=1 Tax=Uniformispora flossi TaxID=3390723 RepID=UPI003C2C201D